MYNIRLVSFKKAQAEDYVDCFRVAKIARVMYVSKISTICIAVIHFKTFFINYQN